MDKLVGFAFGSIMHVLQMTMVAQNMRLQISLAQNMGYGGLGQDVLSWILFFVRHITALPQPKTFGKIFAQIQVFAELWMSWAELNLFFIFSIWRDPS
jgi:hypothetical protein